MRLFAGAESVACGYSQALKAWQVATLSTIPVGTVVDADGKATTDVAVGIAKTETPTS
jgi:LDH2 family malate/lactate/ureidoglycolate dehydrogenase